MRCRLTMRLSDAGLWRRQTKMLYPNHRLPPQLNESATRDRSNRLLDGLLTPMLGHHIRTWDILRTLAASATMNLQIDVSTTIVPTRRCISGIALSVTRKAPLQERLRYPQQETRPAAPKRQKTKPNT